MTPRHVWVTIPFNPTPMPGLLLDWRDREDRREMLVTYWHEADGRAVTDWFPSVDVRPVK